MELPTIVFDPVCPDCGKDLSDAVRYLGPASLAFHAGLHQRDKERVRVARHIKKLRQRARQA